MLVISSLPPQTVESKRGLDIDFGTDVTLNVFPTEVSTADWSGLETVLVQDLRDTSLYQQFSARNAAYVPLVDPELLEAVYKSALIPDVGTSSVNAVTNEQVDVPQEEVVTPPDTIEVPTAVEETTPVEPVPEPSALRPLEVYDSVFTVSTALYQLTALSTTTPVEVVEEVPLDDLVPVAPDTVVEEITDAPLAVAVDETPVVSSSSTEETLVQNPVDEEVVATTSDIVESAPVSSFEEIASTSEAQQTVVNSEVFEITLHNFDTPPLEPGQFVTGVQLRASLAAKLKHPASPDAIPYIEVVFTTASGTNSVGVVLLEDEISNAFNGGYYLFALPEISSVEQLEDAEVTIKYHGDRDDLEGMFLDAAWIEVQTKLITEDDIKDRGKAENLSHLKSPEFTTLVSEDLNFKRSEAPLFNLRYNSQQNSLIKGLRGLFGAAAVEVEEVNVRHNSLGLLGIQPTVSVTKDGLITVEIPDTELYKMRPGSYEIELVLKEGGHVYTDTFNFQWGILAINPSKSEYETGEVTDFSIGALTPSGHTICHANLNLYITDPDGMVERVAVNESGKCNGNNVTDVPDFSAKSVAGTPGIYDLYLERLDDNGDVLGFTTDTFLVTANQKLSIERVGPTRIYPPAPYPMSITVEAEQSFSGTLTERVPREFKISSTTADITVSGNQQILTWDLTMLSGTKRTVSYQFDAPDISPYLFTVGPAELKADANSVAVVASTSTSTPISEQPKTYFVEHREWQIASDAIGNMLLLWADGASVPTDWSCVSCTTGDPFFQRFIMGSSTYNATSGAATHTHTAAGSVLATTNNTTETGSGTAAPSTHTHTYTPTIGTGSNLPEYRQLRVIRYTAAAGEPATIPAGAIGIFDVASSSLPSGWNRYAAQDNRYVYGESTVGSTAGSNTHTHTITGTTGVSAGSGSRTRGGTANAASDAHTHTVSGSTGSVNNEPPYVTVLLGQLTADAAPPNGLIAMWTEDVDGGWLDISSNSGDPFNQKFFKASSTYGVTGGAVSHSHANVTGLTSSGPSATANAVTPGTSGSANNHTHQVDVTSFSTNNHLPPYTTVVFGKRQGTNPVYEQTSSRWYVNAATSTPTDPWPSGGTNLSEREPITATSTPVKNGERVRLRINVGVTNATSTAGADFRLQYAAGDTCSAGLNWYDVGDTSSTTALWRGYNNSGVSDETTLPSQLLASSTVSETYEEDGYASTTPNDIDIDQYGEWDFVLQHNSAVAGTNYCFRMVEGDGSTFANYTHYPRLYTNEAPVAPTLDKLFDNEKTASTTPWFYFVSTDAEGETIDYQIEIDDNYDFSSPTIQRDTINNSSLFENQVLNSDKAPFRQGEQIKFVPTTALTNGTTYYWRVRGQDPDGSDSWGDWSVIYSFTIDTSLTATAWFQTQDEQFDTNALSGVQTGSDQVVLISGSSTGTMISTTIDFNEGQLGTAWDSLTFSDTETSGDIKYQIQYYDETGTWTLIPDADLSGNSTGFDTSPVSLLNIDTNIYDRIRVVANFTNSGGSPSLQDWTINWGYRVETPTITKLFANEQTGTTTPTFEFTTTDPQNDSLTYQISWSTTPDFTSSTTRTSDTDAGFVNIDAGGDLDPFSSGATIQFAIQPADALTGTTTYWWRVRAKDTTGDDAYSFWTEAQSFTVIPGTDVSTWFQTTEEQFNTNILSGTKSLTSDAVTVATTATEAIIVYGEGNETTPRYRQWDGSTLGSEGQMLDVGAPIRWAVARAAVTREEYIAATIGTDSDVNVQVFSTGAWGNLREMTTNVGNIDARGVDIAYETISGNAMVAFCDGDADPSYYMWNGTSWNASGTINLASTNNCEWIRLASDPVSNEIIILSRDSTGGQYEAQVWNGSSWGNSTTQGSMTEAAHEGMAVEYEESGNQAVIVTSDGNPARFRWNTWSGTAWGTVQTQTIGDDFEWGQLVRDVGSDEMALCYQDEDTNIGVVHWTGSAWSFTLATDELLTTTGYSKTNPGFDCVFEDTSGRNNYELITYTDTSQVNYQAWNNTSWSAATQVDSLTTSATMRLIRTGTADVLGVFFDDTNDALEFSTWNGSTWATSTTMESDASVGTSPFGHPYALAARNPGNAGTTIVSPGIDFNDGSGPYWKEFSWNDSQPGTSELRYYLQYQTATGSWAFIPDSVLPGNGAGTTTGPYDLTGLNTVTYNVIRPYAELTCDGSGNCPVLNDWTVTWAGGITISGTAYQYDQTSSTTAGTVAVAVNGVLQTGKVGTISNGAWSISNVTVFPGDIVTVFVSGASDANEAVGVTRYDGTFDIDGMVLYERHVTLGSNDATTTPLTNADVGVYDVSNTEDVFLGLTGSVLQACADTGCDDVELYIRSGTYYSPGGKVVTHDFENNGTLTATTTIEVSGSWDNNASITMTGSTVVFSATSTTESIDSTGASASSFNNVTFGTTTGSGIWTLATTLDVNGNLSVSRGTLARGTTSITVAGTLSTGASGAWAGIGTTTFDGGAAAGWSDASAGANIGYVVVDGTSKIVTLSSNVTAQSITIGANDTLDASASSRDITLYGSWYNQNNFVARAGEVFFAATSSGQNITTTGDAFYDLTFTGGGGTWSFTESSLLVNNNFTVSTGTVNLPANGTTTIAGSFDATGGLFAHNNGTLYFTSAGAETITFDGGLFTNVARNLTFSGAGSWTVTDTNATATNDVRVSHGTLNFPTGTFAIGGTLIDAGGTFVGGTGLVLFYSTLAEVITAGGSSFNDVMFNGTGSWSFSDSNVDMNGDLLVTQGTLTLPSGTLTLGGSYQNVASVTAGTGTLTFDSTDAGETVSFGSSPLYNVNFNSTTGGWTLLSSGTTTNNLSLTNANDWQLDSGQTLSVGGVFTNDVGGASTTWDGSTLSLEAGSYSINVKTDIGDQYDTLRIAAGADIKMWNSSATTTSVDSSASLYSQDHAGTDGDLYIWGTYTNDNGAEYWSYSTDFDGTSLSGSERQANVRFASGASALFGTSTLQILGAASASTTIANQGSGTYEVVVTGGTLNARYYEFSDLGSAGLSLLSGVVVPSLRDGSYISAVNGGSALTISSTTIDANPGKQIFNVSFATTTAIAAFNVSQTDGAPTSYWWFRDGVGNLYGEKYDNDTGDPGSVRFDDSSLVISISGTVYDSAFTPIIGGTCDSATTSIRVMVNGIFATSTTCSNVDGSYTASGIVVTGDPTLTIFLNGAPGGEKGSVITRTPTGNISGVDIYENRVIVRNEDTEPITIANLAIYDNSDDPDLQFVAATTTSPDTLTVLAGNELFVSTSSTFVPGGVVTLAANAGANSYDGTLYIAEGATFNAYSSSTLTIGGRLVLASTTSVFDAASTTVLMNATTSGKSITASSTVTFYDLVFNGVGGSWNLGADIHVDGDMTITNGTVTGTGDIDIPSGSLTGNGKLSLGGGTTTLGATNTLGGTTAWTFYNLTLGDGVQVGTTTPVFTATTSTVSGRLTISAAHFLDAGATLWDLAGSGTVFVENGTFLEDTSTIRYSGPGANVLSTQYYNLDINAGAGGPTYTATGLGIIVDNDLTVGGDSATLFNLNTNDPALDVNGDVLIMSNGTLNASDVGVFTIAGNFDNNGSFTGNGGRVTFDGAGTISIAPGNSSFSNVTVDATGDVTVSEHATATQNWRLENSNTFTLASGQSLAVGGRFLNDVGGGATTWTNSTLRLYGGADYLINTSTTSDTYATIDIDDTTQIRMWNSDAGTYSVATNASLYSQDHAGVDGDLYIWGNYRKSSAADRWSYARDFDGTDLSGGSERKVDVFIATSSSVTITGGNLLVVGASTASTTIQSMGTATYGLTIGGTGSTTMRYYEIRDTNSSGLVFTGTPRVNTLSNGDFEMSQNGGSAMTVGGTVITQNPAKNFNLNRFTLNAASGFNVTATGTTVSSWRFVNHYGGLDGEANDVDPNGDPGYIAWDDSAALITISGNVYANEGSGVSGVCDGSSPVVQLVVAGLSSASTSCNATTGAYSFANIAYGPNDSLIVYLNGVTQKAAVVTKEPISNINGLDLYEYRVIVRHENTDPITIADMAVHDSSDDPDIPFTAVDAGTDTLTLPSDRKLIVWNSKEFEPNGNVTITNGGSQSYGGSLQLYSGATWTGIGTESLSVGGSMTLDSGAAFVASNGTTTFTSNGTSTIDVNENDFHHIAFTGSGNWSITDPTFTVSGNYSQSAGSVTFPTGTSTFSGSLAVTGGDFDANGGLDIFDGASTKFITTLGSSLAEVWFTGGDYQILDTNATTTESVTIYSGDITLPSGVFEVGGDFRNIGGTVTHNTSVIQLSNASSATLLASSSDLYAVTFSGGGTYLMEDANLTLLDSLTITNGSVTLATGTLSIGGSFDASGGTFDHASGTILFNSSDVGETIDPGVSDFYTIQFSAPTGGYTFTADATTTANFYLLSAASFTAQSGVDLVVGGVFLNNVGGSNTTWSGSTLYLNGANAYSINSKTDNGDQYDTLIIGGNSDLRIWNSAATTTTVDPSSSLYSQDHAGNDGYVYIYGDFHIGAVTEYWSYATDFDGTSLSGGSERSVLVAHAANATTTVDGGVLQVLGVSGNETTITNQGSGTYGLLVTSGTVNFQYYDFRNLNDDGLYFSGAPVITSLSYGDFELAVNGGTLITLASTTLNANASKVVTGMRFATTTAITGYNVTLVGSTSNAWSFTSHTGNLDGEDFDVDGATACGSIRWSDSSCLLVQQTNYRWRNDDGGAGVPDSEWFNSNWAARKQVRVFNDDATPYTDAVVQMFVTYDSDMQADFDDLRFTDSSGTTTIPYWLGSTTNSVAAEVWVQVPTLPAEGIATIFMYYNNPSASASSSATDTFIAADDFEDGNITEYSGETGDFTVDGTFAYDGVYALDATSNETGRTENGGMYTLSQSVSQGETIRFKQYLNPSQSDETCVLFGVQSTSAPDNNYGLCVDLNGTDRLVLARNAVDSADTPPAVTLDSANISIAAGWYTFEIDWGSGVIDVEMWDEAASSTAVLSASDSNYSTGGFGFTFWFQHGGWDSFTSRTTLTTEPSVIFGAEQADGGATWKAAQNATAAYDIGDIARLRLAIENSGLAITNQQYRLEYANMGAAPSCEAVNPSNFQAVPVQSSCGSSPICMQSSSYVTNGAATVDLLTDVNGTFSSGELREDPSNTTGNLNIDQDYYTELEYVITPTINVSDEYMCFRVTNAGTELDTYLSVARMAFQFDPIVSTIILNDGQPISLLPGATTTVYATGTVTDLNGTADLNTATSTIYRSGVAGGAACTIDNNNCYVSTSNDFCSFTNCSGNTCDIECYAEVYFHADPTDVGTYAGEEWVAFVEVEDMSAGYGFNSTASGVELNTLRAIDVTSAIDYGSLAPQTNTGASNASTSIFNLGNVAADVEIYGTDLTDGISSSIASTYQKFATSTFNYSLCGASCNLLSSTTPTNLDVDLTKPTVDDPLVSDDVFWGVAIPFGVNSAPYQGVNVFTPVSP